MNWPNVEVRGPMPLPIAKEQVNKASALSWANLLNVHVSDFESYYKRCVVKLNANQDVSVNELSAANRLMRYAKGETDVTLPALYFNFGRYLLISSSRPNGLPANLQGLWAVEYQTPWNGDYHLNINAQMNYWPAEVTQLNELHEPFIQMIKDLAQTGQQSAKEMYGARGWMATAGRRLRCRWARPPRAICCGSWKGARSGARWCWDRPRSPIAR